MKRIDIRLKLPDLPRHVAISSAVLLVSALVFAVLYGTLGKNLIAAQADNAKLKNNIAQTSKSIGQVDDDYKFVTDNLQRFEGLLQSERLVPHTRRDAIDRLQQLARQFGVTSLTWVITDVGDRSVATAASQAKTQGYRVNAASIDLKIGAPLDGQIYKFVSALTHDFPGGAVISGFSLERTTRVTDDMLKNLSQGGGFVGGDVKFLWRTAQANEPEKKP